MEKSWNQCKFAKDSNDEVSHYLPANTFQRSLHYPTQAAVYRVLYEQRP